MAEFERIGLVGRPGHQGVVDSLQRLQQVLLQKQVRVVLEEATAELLPGHGMEVSSRDKLSQECDLVIVVGGDGSMLNVAQVLASHHVPVLGVNRGRLGFLTDILPEEIEPRLVQILNGEYTEETRFLLEFEARRAGEVVGSGCALNDVVLHPGTAARMIGFELFVNREFVNSQESDGLIVATPTGSTAYALSAGGPIMHPGLNAIVLVPMYPHTLSSRPLVVDGDSEIKIRVVRKHDILPQVSCDGAVRFITLPGDEVVIRKRSGPLRLIHPLDHSFYEACRSKLGWGRRLVRQR